MRSLFPILFLTLMSLGIAISKSKADELKIYTQTIETLIKAAEPIVDRLAVAERRNAVRLIDQGAEVNGATAGVPDTSVDDELVIAPRFAVEHALYFSQSGYPPLANSFASTFRALERFNRSLVYADALMLDTVRADFEILARSISSAYAVSGKKPPEDGAEPSATVGSDSSAFGSREALIEILKGQGANLISLLHNRKDSVPAVFDQLTQKLYDERELKKLHGEKIKNIVARIRRERALVGELVVIIDVTIFTLEATLLAIGGVKMTKNGSVNAQFLSSEIEARLKHVGNPIDE